MKRIEAGQTAGKPRPRPKLKIAYPPARPPEVLERELEEMTARVEELERERAQCQDFAAMAAHELLQPLVMTEAYATQVSERAGRGLDLNSRHDLDAIVRISRRVRLLVDELLVSARETDRPLRREPVDVTEVIRDCVRVLGPEIETRSAHLDIDPMPIVEGDPVLLSGVFSNLLSNALKYGPRSGGDIHVSAVRSVAGWTFAVQSVGPAIAAEGRERIFEAWERAPGERRAKGAGIGLAIVRHIVERHGGHIGVSSPSDTSNRFFFTLPA
jgi:light-regulated signal transduction histidine kinase (bacteriophytochrome)